MITKLERGVRAMRTKIFIGIIICIVIAGVAPPIFASYETSLLYYWKFDETSGDTAADSTGHTNVTFNNTGNTSWGVGKFGNAVMPYNGVSQEMPVLPTAGTFSVWLKIPTESDGVGLAGYADVNSFDGPGGLGATALFMQNSSYSGYSVLYPFVGDNNSYYWNNSVQVPMSVYGQEPKWSHVAITWNIVSQVNHYDEVASIYVNGNPTAVSNTVIGEWSLSATGVPFLLGGVRWYYEPGSTEDYPLSPGTYMDDTAVWNRALDSNEIKMIYDLGVEKYENLLIGMNTLFNLGYSSSELKQLSDLYLAQEGEVTIDDVTWEYIPHDDPIWTGHNPGDIFINMSTGQRYIYLGGGLGEKGAPDPATVFGMAITAMIFFGKRRGWIRRSAINNKW
ncbi:MAG: LamG domain-containing protein [Candidatus Omnitrophica bacterium]|nr:LamG domain-containing protein [Candidatus Omnitrophota bacterium]